MPDVWGILSIASKFSIYFGFFWSAGLVMNQLAFAGVLAPVKNHLRKLIVVFALIGVIGAGLNLILRGAILMDDVSGMYDPAILGLLWNTPPGDVLLMRAIAAGLLIVGAVIGGFALWLALIGGLISFYSFAAIGHVPGAGGLWLQIILVLHLAVAAFWIGVFTPLRMLASRTETLPTAAMLGHQFGIFAIIAVPVLIIAGLAMSWQLLGSVPAMWQTSYGITLLVKIGVVGLLLTLAAMNKLRFVPALELSNRNAGQALARSIRFEWVCVTAILLATAILTSVLPLPNQ